MPRAAFYLACGAAVASMVSIAACQILLGATLAAILFSRQRLEFPPIGLVLLLFVILTLASLALSSDPRAGLPQVKKFFVYLMLPVIFTAIRHVSEIKPLVWWWAAMASASALWSFVQFWTRRQRALEQQADLYLTYVGDRVTGFMSHWMTFGATQMAALLLLLAFLIFAKPRRYRWLLTAAAAVIAASIVIGWTRSVWLATAISSGYLVAVWRPRLLILAPVLFLAGWMVAPGSVRERVVSIYQPRSDVDSNQHRSITRRVGIEMIRAHPWLGLGPEMPGKQFDQYTPPDVPKPLPVGFYGHLHNVYLQFAAERGIPALVTFLCMIGIMLRDWFKRAVSSVFPDQRAVLHGCVAVILAILIEGFFEHNLGDSEVLSIFWVVVAWGYRAWEAKA
jgi:putative inorganic carbon (HCO3(-)) transporter